ncbi:MAG: PAS domain S-box protein [Lacunisphaera sp.]|nr:PAS domain S-box protein [Lacunisphaera sp.]
MNPNPLSAASRFAVVVNDDPTQLSILSGLVRKAGLEPCGFNGPEAALALMASGELPALIVTDLHMPGIDGWRFCRLLRSPEYAILNKIPILVVSATYSGSETERIAADLGAEAFLPAPVDGAHFCAQVRAILSGTQVRSALRVLIVEESVGLADLIKEHFISNGHQATTEQTVQAANDAFRRSIFDVAVLSHRLSDGSGEELLASFRTERPDCVCLMVTHDTAPDLALKWMKAGAAAYLHKPFDLGYLLEICFRARREQEMYRVQELLEIRTRALRESEERYRLLVEQGPLAIIVHRDGRIVFANKMAGNLMGARDSAELIGKPILGCVHPDEHELVQQRMRMALAGDQVAPWQVERLLRLDGSELVAEVMSFAFRFEGQPSVQVIVRDITERQQAEAALRVSESNLREAQNLALLGRWELDLASHHLQWSETIFTIFEIEPKQFAASYEVFFEAVHPDDREKVALAHTKSIESKLPFEVTHRLLMKDGRIKWVKEKGRTEYNPLGKAVRSVGIVHDVTERKQLEEGLEKRILALTRPLPQDAAIAFGELFDLAGIQRLQDDLAAATGVASIITRPDGTPLTRPSRFTRLCSQIVRQTKKGCANCHLSDATLGSPRADGPIVRTCLSGGLWDAGASITVGGHHIANWLIGQVRDETQTDDAMRAYAREIGTEETAFLEAFHEVPAMSREQFGRVAQALFTLANQLSTSAYQNVQQARFIAERQEAEAALRESKARQRQLLQNLSVGVVVHGPDTQILLHNQKALTLLRLSAEELSGKTAMDPAWCFVDETGHRLPLTEYPVMRVLANRLPLVDFVLGVDRPGQGDRIWVLVNAYPEFDEQQQVRQVVVTFADITARMLAQAALGASVARHAKMVANIGDVIVIIDPAGINRYKSSNIEKLFGWRPEEVVGAPALANVHPDDVPAARAFIENLLEKPHASGTIECRYRCKNGAYKWIEFTGIGLVQDPEIGGLLGNYCDITERKQAEAEREKLQSRLTQVEKMESVGRLAGGVAHDFNNMLTAIQINASLGLDGLSPDNPVHENLVQIMECAKRSADLTGQLLAFARKQTIAPTVLDLNATVAGMLKMMRRLIGENIDLVWRPGADLWPVLLDSSQIDQVMTNLCVNASDAIGGVGKITLETHNTSLDAQYCARHADLAPGDYVLLSVTDDGAGMDKEIMGQLFEPFFTTKGVGQGIGLGLATVYGIVRQNRGTIEVFSEPGHGATFKIYLPRHADKAAQAPAPAATQTAVDGHETILLVEDEPSILWIAQRVLESLGYTVLAAGTPSEALRLAEKHNGAIQLLMTDVVMPDMNGRDLAKKLISLYPDIKCLFMSGYTDNVIAPHGVLDDGMHFIQKPFLKSDLADKVRAALDDE